MDMLDMADLCDYVCGLSKYKACELKIENGVTNFSIGNLKDGKIDPEFQIMLNSVDEILEWINTKLPNYLDTLRVKGLDIDINLILASNITTIYVLDNKKYKFLESYKGNIIYE
jgi:hypothetical protein